MSCWTARKRYLDARVTEGQRVITANLGRNRKTEKMAIVPLGGELRKGRYSPGELLGVLFSVLLLFGFIAAFPAGLFLGLVGELALESPAFASSVLVVGLGDLEMYGQMFLMAYGRIWFFAASWGAIIGLIITPVTYLGLIVGLEHFTTKTTTRS